MWNAALRSGRTSTQTEPWSEAIQRSSVTFTSAVSVLWCSLKADWKTLWDKWNINAQSDTHKHNLLQHRQFSLYWTLSTALIKIRLIENGQFHQGFHMTSTIWECLKKNVDSVWASVHFPHLCRYDKQARSHWWCPDETRQVWGQDGNWYVFFLLVSAILQKHAI